MAATLEDFVIEPDEEFDPSQFLEVPLYEVAMYSPVSAEFPIDLDNLSNLIPSPYDTYNYLRTAIDVPSATTDPISFFNVAVQGLDFGEI